MTRRDVDQEAALDLPLCDCLKMVADGLDMPVALKARWLNTPPKPANKVEQRTGRGCAWNPATKWSTAAQFEDAFARFLPHEPNIRTLKRGRERM